MAKQLQMLPLNSCLPSNVCTLLTLQQIYVTFLSHEQRVIITITTAIAVMWLWYFSGKGISINNNLPENSHSLARNNISSCDQHMNIIPVCAWCLIIFQVFPLPVMLDKSSWTALNSQTSLHNWISPSFALLILSLSLSLSATLFCTHLLLTAYTGVCLTETYYLTK